MNREQAAIESTKVDYEFTFFINDDEYSDNGDVIIMGHCSEEKIREEVNKNIVEKVSEYLSSNEINLLENVETKAEVKITNIRSLSIDISLKHFSS